MTDQEIIALYHQRSQSALEETSIKYQKYCHTIAMNILQNREDAQECFNDALMRTWNSIPPKMPRNLATYIGKITRNLAIDIYRRHQSTKRHQHLAQLSELEHCLSSELQEDKELLPILNEFLRKLSKEKRVIFVRRYWHCDAIADIANRYNMSESKVKTSLFRSREKLRVLLKKEGITL